MCGEWLFIINVALISIYRYVCGLNGSLYSMWMCRLKMSIYCYKCVVNGYLSLMSPYVALCRFIVIRVWVKWLFVLKCVASMSIYCYKCVVNGYLSLMSP